MVSVSGAWAHSPVGWWPVGWPNSLALSSGNKRRKGNRGLSFLRPRFHVLFCGSSWWGGWGAATTAQQLALDTPGINSEECQFCPGIVCPLPSLLKVNWAVTRNPLEILFPHHSLDTFRQNNNKKKKNKKRHRWADSLSSLLPTTVPRGKSSTLCLYHKYSD